jgi:hypothetical protein
MLPRQGKRKGVTNPAYHQHDSDMTRTIKLLLHLLDRDDVAWGQHREGQPVLLAGTKDATAKAGLRTGLFLNSLKDAAIGTIPERLRDLVTIHSPRPR